MALANQFFLASAVHPFHAFLMRVPQFGGHNQIGDKLPLCVLGLIAKYLFSRLVEINNAALNIGYDNAVQRRGQDRLHACIGRNQGLTLAAKLLVGGT